MLSVILLVQLLVVSTVVSAEGENTSEGVSTVVSYDANAKKLLALGLLDEEQIMDSDSTITKGEFCAIVVKLFALEQFVSTPEHTYFYDVPISHPYIREISFLYEAGMINGTGDNKFGADDAITFDAALTILLRGLGYENVAARNGGYPTGYYRVADNYGVLDGIEIGGSKQLLAGDMYKLLANAAETVVCEVFPVGSGVEYVVTAGNTLLWSLHKIKSGIGIVTGNNYSTLAAARAKATNTIQIDGVDYINSDESFNDLLGMRVKYYVKDGDEDTAVYVEEYRTEKIRIDAEDILNVSNSKITYMLENDKEESISIDTYYDTLYNGVALSGYGLLRSVMPESGYVELIDNDKDYDADVILITEGRDIIINNIDKENGVVYDKLTEDAIALESGNGTVVAMRLADGTVIRIGQIGLGDIVSIYESKNTTGMKIKRCIISREFISGKLTEIRDTDTYVINGSEYKKSASNTKDIKMGDSGIFYLNHIGKIVLYSRMQATDMKFAVVRGTEYDSFSAELTVRLFTQDGVFENFECASTVALTYGNTTRRGKLDDTNFVSELRTKLAGGAVVMYRLAGDGSKIAEFCLADENATTPAALNLLDKDSIFVYYSKCVGGKFLIDETTVVFNVPVDLTVEDKYSLMTVSNLNALEGGSISSDYSAYYLGDSKLVPACAMKVTGLRSVGSILYSTRLSVIEDVSQGMLDDETVSIVKLVSNKKSHKLYLTADEKANIEANLGHSLNLKAGDVVRYTADTDGLITNVQIVCDGTANGILASPAVGGNAKLENTTSFYQTWRVVYGVVEEVNVNNGVFSYVIPYTEGLGDGKAPKLEIRNASSAQIMKFNATRGKAQVGTINDINVGDIVIIRSTYSAPQDIVVIK